MKPVPFFAEICAGSAAVSLQLLGGQHAVPPIAYMGSKRSLARAILSIAGLRRGQGAERVLLADAGPWGLTWRVLTDSRGRAAVAAQLRAWEGEDPRELWRWLSTMPPEALGVAGWLWLQGRSASGVPVWWESSWRQCHGGRRTHSSASQRGEADGSSGLQRPTTLAARVEAFGSWVRGEHPSKSLRPQKMAQTGTGAGKLNGLLHPGTVGARVQQLPVTPVVVHHGDVRDLVPPDDLPDGAVVLIDPPYVGCTGYSHHLGREQVVDLARLWGDAGATVLVCESEPIEPLGWHHVEITDCRDGCRVDGKPEWITVNREPAWRPRRTMALPLGAA